MKPSRLFNRLIVLLAMAAMLSGHSLAGKPPAYFVNEERLPFEALPGATAYWGIHARAGYRIEVPDNWNGDLLIWAHGFRGTGLELYVDNPPFRELLIAQGYAWAASSYDRNDYDITSGVQSSHALLKRFNGIVSKPDKVYLSGASMGGHITGVAIEQYPNTFAGALPVCGVMGDYALFDYFLDFSATAQQLGTGNSQYPVDPLIYVGLTIPQIKAGLEAFPGTWPFTLNAAGENHKNLTELRSGGVRPNFDEAFSFWNSIPAATGPGNFLLEFAIGDGSLARAPGSVSDNFQTVYQFDTDPALTPEEQALNDNVVRVVADPQTRRPNGLAQVPTISGDITIPVLTMHNLGDLFVPVLNQVAYGERVLEQGNQDLLVQRAIRGVAHCEFTQQEYSQAWGDLVRWVEDGVKPEGDDFLDPDEVADPSFGCTFTDGPHLLATPCP
jgi:pimeloyl-ACP methyl ester carboxylesterase